jgi:hypothetical protein
MNQFRENYAPAPAMRPASAVSTASTVKDVFLAVFIGAGLALALVQWWSV